MTFEAKIKLQLNQQRQLIVDSKLAVEYIINCADYVINKIKYEPVELGFFYQMAKDNTILKLTALFHQNENYSFNGLTKILLKRYKNNDQLLKDYFKELKSANKLFDELKILKIRNTHVAHIDISRSHHTLDWKKVKKLVNKAEKIHDLINSLIFDTVMLWDGSERQINRIFKKDLILHKLNQMIRKKYQTDKKNIRLLDLDKLIRIQWPNTKNV